MNKLPDIAVLTEKLSKTYNAKKNSPAVHALDEVNISIPRGSIYGILGPNGAGKSTLINILGGMTKKTSGSVTVWDRDLDTDARNVRAAIGIVPQEINMDPFFTPRALLEIQAGMYGIPKSQRKTEEIIEMLGLQPQAESYARTLSGGMQRRLLIAKAMVHSPPILVLDEPTAGVDVELRHKLWESVRTLNDEGVTIILTTHYLKEAEELCKYLSVINKGKILVTDTTSSLLKTIDNKTLLISLKKQVTDTSFFPDILNVTSEKDEMDKPFLRIEYSPNQISAGEILALITGKGFGIQEINTIETDLEDVFIKLTREDDAA